MSNVAIAIIEAGKKRVKKICDLPEHPIHKFVAEYGMSNEDLLERFRLENANLRRELKELQNEIVRLQEFIKSDG